jgi:hypothetical protein
VNIEKSVSGCIVELARDLMDSGLVSQFGSHDKSIIVEYQFEVILTHLPLWANESGLFMIGRMLDNHKLEMFVRHEDVEKKLKEYLKEGISLSDSSMIQYS